MPLSWTLRDGLPEHGYEEGPYIFDRERAERIVWWFGEYLVYPEGPKAGKPFLLPPWQANYLGAMEGWRKKEDGLRRFTRGLVGVGRGNAKSSFIAGRSIKGLIGDGVPVPKVIIGGTDRENAGIIFGYGAGMVRKDKRLKRRLRVLDSTKRIFRKPVDGGLLRVISSDSQHAHGIHPTFLAIDDVQAQPNREFLGVLSTSQGTVEEPLMFMCMTAGNDTDSVGWEEWEHGLLVMKDPNLDEQLLVDLYYLEEDDDWENEDLWIKANPNLNISVFKDFIRQQVKRAKERPRLRNEILQLHFNIWPRGEVVPFIPRELWLATAGSLDLRMLNKEECYVGVMATSSVDIANVAYYFPPRPGKPASVIVDSFVPADNVKRMEDANKVSYQRWISDGWLQETEGNIIDEDFIVQSIQRRAQRFVVQDIGVNPRSTASLMRKLDEKGFLVTQTLPSYGNMDPALDEMEKLVKAKEFIHSSNMMLNHSIGNLQVRKNTDGDLKPDHEKSPGNISAAISVLMAMSRHLASETNTGQLEAS